MATTTRSRVRRQRTRKTAQAFVPDLETGRPFRPRRGAEAPDRGEPLREAPEARELVGVEAPDAGEAHPNEADY